MTQKRDAEKGIITAEMKAAAAYEGVDPEFIRRGLADGTIVIPKNKNHHLERIRAVGRGTRTKVNANIGASPYHSAPEEEVRKLEAAARCGADSVMDLSLGSHLIPIRRQLLDQSPIMLGTVPIYQTAYELSSAGRDIADMTIHDFLGTIRRQAEEGVDFMTIHSGVTRQTIEFMENQGRELDVVSRGGSFMVSWLRKNKGDSPLYVFFDDMLDILADHDVTLSLGDGLRPGTTLDANDRAQISELTLLGELTRRAWAKGVQVIVEGPGHVPLHQVADHISLQKSLCRGAPFYVLGPLVTDIAAGHDHVAGAIGGAVAAMNGADFLCYVTPAEHLRLPTPDDVVQGVIASRIAAQAADLAKGMTYAVQKEQAMAQARKTLDWDRQFELYIDSDKARQYRRNSEIGSDDVCTMCGEFCAIKRLQDRAKDGPE